MRASNLDYICIKYGQEIGLKSDEANLQKALGVLREDGVYAMFLWLENKDKKTRESLIPLLNQGCINKYLQNDSQNFQGDFKSFCENLKDVPGILGTPVAGSRTIVLSTPPSLYPPVPMCIGSRAGEDYSYYSARPYYFYQISQIIKLWEILKNSLSSSQINYIEETLTCKLREWRNVNDSNKECVFTRFEEATLKDAFANRWEKLRKETQDFIINSALNKLLLDTIVLFRHIIKQKEDEENE